MDVCASLCLAGSLLHSPTHIFIVYLRCVPSLYTFIVCLRSVPSLCVFALCPRPRLQLAGHNMTLLALDGVDVEPLQITTLNLHIGERADVLVCANQRPGYYPLELM